MVSRGYQILSPRFVTCSCWGGKGFRDGSLGHRTHPTVTRRDPTKHRQVHVRIQCFSLCALKEGSDVSGADYIAAQTWPLSGFPSTQMFHSPQTARKRLTSRLVRSPSCAIYSWFCFLVSFPRLISELPVLLENCDYVCSILPSTPETRGLFSGDVLQHCHKKVRQFSCSSLSFILAARLKTESPCRPPCRCHHPQICWSNVAWRSRL